MKIQRALVTVCQYLCSKWIAQLLLTDQRGGLSDVKQFNHHDISQVSLITGLEYGLEQWNGLWNLCVQWTAPFTLSSSFSVPFHFRRVSFIASNATRMHLLKLIRYAHNPMRELVMNTLVSK